MRRTRGWPAQIHLPRFEQRSAFEDHAWIQEALAKARRIYQNHQVHPGVPAFEHAVNSARTVFESTYPNPAEESYLDPNQRDWARSMVLAALFHEAPMGKASQALAGESDALTILQEMEKLRQVREAAKAHTDALERISSTGINPHTSAAYLIRIASVNHALQEGRSPEYLRHLAEWTQDVYVPMAKTLGLGRLAQELDEHSVLRLLEHNDSENRPAPAYRFTGLTAQESMDHYLDTLNQHGLLAPAIQRSKTLLTNSLHEILLNAGVAGRMLDANGQPVLRDGQPLHIGASEASAAGFADIYLREKGIVSIARKRRRYALEGRPSKVENIPDLLSVRLVLHSQKRRSVYQPATFVDATKLLKQHLLPWVQRQNDRFTRIQTRRGNPASQLINVDLEGYVDNRAGLPATPPKGTEQLFSSYTRPGRKPNGYSNIHLVLNWSHHGALPAIELHLLPITAHTQNEYGPSSHFNYKGMQLPPEIRGELAKLTETPATGRNLARVTIHHPDGNTQFVTEPPGTSIGKALTRAGINQSNTAKITHSRRPDGEQTRISRSHPIRHGMHYYLE